MLQVLVAFVLFYMLLLAFVALFQRRLIYFPQQFSPAVADVLGVKAGFQPWRNASGQSIGWKMPATLPSVGTVLVMHGNAGCALDRDYFAKPIHQAAAVDVYVLEYPGYGARTGVPGLKDFLAAAEEAFATLPKGRPVYLVSESLGTGVATYLAKLHGTEIAGLALLAPYDDFASVGQRHMRWVPVSWLMRDRFTPATWLRDYRGPIVLVIAGEDEVIPAELGLRLHDGYAGPKQLQVVKGARHNDIAAQSPQWWKEVFSFWQQHPPEPTGTNR